MAPQLHFPDAHPGVLEGNIQCQANVSHHLQQGGLAPGMTNIQHPVFHQTQSGVAPRVLYALPPAQAPPAVNNQGGPPIQTVPAYQPVFVPPAVGGFVPG